ncbi:MAG TPA: DUF5672 family protein [Alphaproteobacteria bacterium]|nr:DUF5672 family protein [Alphaproteobacteria bacterium]
MTNGTDTGGQGRSEDDFRRITVVSVTGLQSVAEGAVRSIVRSCREMPGARALLLSPERPASTPDWVEHVAIAPFGYTEYSLFVLYALGDFIETDFALVVQDDGWVVSGGNWRREFLDYDYIGAPNHFARVIGPAGAAFHRHFQWQQFLGAPATRIQVVYNGGFSLRSKRLMDAPRQLGIPLVVPPVSTLEGPQWRMKWEDDITLEDVQLCTVMRDELERGGVRFAPVGLAREFSIEHAGRVLHADFDVNRVFGHHSKLRKIVSADPPVARYTVARRDVDGMFGEDRIVRMLETHGIRVEYA